MADLHSEEQPEVSGPVAVGAGICRLEHHAQQLEAALHSDLRSPPGSRLLAGHQLDCVRASQRSVAGVEELVRVRFPAF